MFVKICGITSTLDATIALDAGASAIGLNFVPSSPRKIDVGRAREIADAVRGKVEIFGVVADLDDEAIAALVNAVDLDVIQLHGDESPEDAIRIAALTSRRVVKAVRVGSAADLDGARRFSGMLLVDAKVKNALGGTGQKADWSAAATVAGERQVILAGGLDAANVAKAIAQVMPFGVDVASGVERAAGVKERVLVERFVNNSRS